MTAARAKSWCLAAVGVAGLVLLAVSYLQPAPSIRVRWHDDVTAARQAELESRYGLTNPSTPLPDAPRSVAYALRDTSRANIEALVRDPQVADTNDIDREHFETVVYRGIGERWVAATLRILRLRDGRVQALAFLVCAVMAAAGIRRIAAGRRRAWAAPPTTVHAEPDPFDALAERYPALLLPATAGEGPRAGLRKLLTVALAILACGVPIVERWEALLLAAVVIITASGAARPGMRRIAAAATVLLAVVGGKAMLPRADIAEAHNAFMVLGRGEALERGLPGPVFRSWKAQFDALYPPAAEPYQQYSWRAHSSVPPSLFAASSDAIWRTPAYTRQVDAIDFAALAEFRGGFANDLHYNFWTGDLARSDMPFYVMYELSPASVGSRLAWTGQVFWQRADGGFDEIVHPEFAARAIAPGDSGRRVYAAFFPQRDGPRPFRLERSATLKFGAWAEAALTVGGVAAILTLMVRGRRVATLRALTMAAAGYLLVASTAAAAYLGPGYPPLRGSDDGLFYESVGREMAMFAGRGEVVKAMEGGEPIYWFTPGFRYFRMIEKLVFGDTNLLYGVVVACIPLAVLALCRQFFTARRAFAVALLFVLLPVGNFSFANYLANGALGYSEALGCGLFLTGLVLLMRAQPAWGGTSSVPLAAAAGAMLAASMIVRPNFALAVAWCGAACAWTSLQRGEVRSSIAVSAGLALALWMPFHNWFYGGEFHLVGRTQSLWLALGVGDYATAIMDTASGRSESPTAIRVTQQLRAWLGGPGFVDRDWLMPLAWVMHAVKLCALLVSAWVAARFASRSPSIRVPLGVMAVAALLAHVPMLFIWETPARYAMLAWDLCLLVLLVHWGAAVPSARAAAAEDNQIQ